MAYSIGPTSVPALVARHQEDLMTPIYQTYASAFMRGLLESGPAKGRESEARELGIIKSGESRRQTSMRLGGNWCEVERNMLNIATLFHVTEPMLALAMTSARKMPADETWQPSDLPSNSGFMVFEKPLMTKDIRGLNQCFAAVSWNYLMAPYKDNPLGYVEFALYTDNDDMRDEINQLTNAKGYRAPGRFSLAHAGSILMGMPIGPFDWPTDDGVNAQYLLDHPTDANLESFLKETRPSLKIDYTVQQVNLFLIIYSVFALMQQSLAEIDEYTDKRLARRHRGKRRPPPIVSVIRLRHPEQFGAHEEGTGNWLTSRSMTRSHWRRQHYADGTVKRIFIHAYWRGSTDLPVWQPKRVTSLQR